MSEHWHFEERVHREAKFILEYLLKLQLYPSYDQSKVWEDIIEHSKRKLSALLLEAKSSEMKHRPYLFELLYVDALGEIGLSFIEYHGDPEVPINLRHIKDRLKDLIRGLTVGEDEPEDWENWR
ncbi:MAG: hypothetical protein EOP06_11715 [Proteobacteria bacterium]|nr:MAG: hypothetical protein EOP06_11715 [Pseudomonadota bacterium]